MVSFNTIKYAPKINDLEKLDPKAGTVKSACNRDPVQRKIASEH